MSLNFKVLSVSALSLIMCSSVIAQSKKSLSDYVYSIEASAGVHTGLRQLRDVKDDSKWQDSKAMENSVGRQERAILDSKFGKLEWTDATYLNPDVAAASPYKHQQELFRLKYTSPSMTLKDFDIKGVKLKLAANVQMDQIVWNKKHLGSFDQEVDPAQLPVGTVVYEKYRTLNPSILLTAPNIPIVKTEKYSVDASGSVGIIPVGMVNFRRKDANSEFSLKKDNTFAGISMAFAVAIKEGDRTFLRFFYDQTEQMTFRDPENKMMSSNLTLGCQLERRVSPNTVIGLTGHMNEILQKISIPEVSEGSIVKTSAVSVSVKYQLNHKKAKSEVHAW